MDGWVCSEEEVNKFLSDMRLILTSGSWQQTLYFPKRNEDSDKTHKFMVTHNIDGSVIYEELLKLDATNYFKTDYENPPGKPTGFNRGMRGGIISSHSRKENAKPWTSQ